MKLTVENKITHPTFKRIESFGLIINSLVACEDKDSLKNEIAWLFCKIEISDYFDYGFGGSHLWITEKCTNKRIIFIEL